MKRLEYSFKAPFFPNADPWIGSILNCKNEKCAKQFTPTNEKQIYCTKRCAQIVRRKKSKCQN